MNKKKLVGRPTIMTKEVIDKLETSYSMGCSDIEACMYANITPSVLYRYQESHPEFKERKAMLKEKLILKARTVIANALNEKDTDTAKWYLERKARDEFSTKQVVQNEPIVQKVFISKEDEQEVTEHIADVIGEC